MTDATFRSHMTVEVIDHMGSDLSPVRAARVSTYGAASVDSTESQGLLNFLMREGHHTPFESQVVTFRIEAPIFVTRQILKHRVASINEESGRYRELDGVFYAPDRDRDVVQVGKTGDYQFTKSVDKNDLAEFCIRDSASRAWDDYEYLLEKGIAKEVARMVLPVSLYSTLYLTMNSRSLMNFFKLRTSWWGSHPQAEIEMVAERMYDQWDYLFPYTGIAFRLANPMDTNE